MENEKNEIQDASILSNGEKKTSSEKMEDKSVKADEKKTPSKNFKRFIPLAIVVVLSMGIGAGAGILLYRWNNPDGATLTAAGYEGYVPTQEEMTKSLSAGTLEIDFQSKVYQVVNYSLAMHSKSKYALTIGKAKVLAKAGVTVQQNIQSCTYTTPDVIYNQNVSSSSVVKTANRFYDYLDGKVQCYLESLPDDWKNSSSTEYTYDEYMQKYGKLLSGSYYCTTVRDSSQVTEANPISDRYLSLNEEDYDNSTDDTKHHVNGVVIYLIGPTSVKESSIEKTESGYKVSVDLFTDKDKAEALEEAKKISVGTSYYSVQMRTTGGLNSRPSFSLSHLEFNLDSNLGLVSSYFKDEYSAIVGPISSTTSSEMYQYYFRSESNCMNDVTIAIPNPNDPDTFNGYDLFPQELSL
jgi:hypothetical protein